MQKNGNKKELHKCINDFWHKTHFFLCYNAYFFLVNNIKSVSVIYPTKKNIGKNSWHFFRFVNVLVSTKKSKKPPQKTKCCIKFFLRNATFLLTKCCCNQDPKTCTNWCIRFSTRCRKFWQKKPFFAGEANAPSTVKVASLALSKANSRLWAILKLLFWTQWVISTLCVQQRQQTSFGCRSFMFFLPDGCDNMSL